MKNFSILFLFFLLPTLNAQTSLAGKITDENTGEELIAANVTLHKADIFITGVTTDFDGNYAINLDPGTYDVVVSYIGYQMKRTNGVIVRAGQRNVFNVQLGMGGGINLEEVIVKDYKVPMVEQDNTTQGAIVSGDEIRKFASKNISAVATSTAGISSNSSDQPVVVTAKKPNAITETVISSVQVVENKKSKKRKDTKTSTASKQEFSAVTEKSAVKAGQLTAGEWKDLDNWTFWQNLMKDGAFSKYKKHWGYAPDHRFAVKLSDEQGRAIANVTIQLLNEANEVIWNAKTDNKGHTELWGNFFNGNAESFKIQIQQDDYTEQFKAIPYEKGLNSFSLPLDCSVNKSVDVAFVVDATNSMRDEIAYLKAEITDVLQRTEEENDISLRSAAVFYTDRHNPTPYYETPLTSEHDLTIAFIKRQRNSSGGKEWAEAPDLGLERAIREMDWNENAIARIIFLILDAPPHNKEDHLKKLEKTIALAAEKGIKIIPVAASGTKKDAEFILKFFAMATNGTYTFLTDHSGIGNPHIKPEAGDYNIETLNDMLVRLIGENSTYHDCAPVESYVEEGAQKTKLKWREKRDSEIKAFIKQIKCFPNPATDYVFVSLEEAVDLLLITTSDGKRIQQFPEVEAGEIKIQTSEWASGAYFFHFYLDGKHVVEKVFVGRR